MNSYVDPSVPRSALSGMGKDDTVMKWNNTYFGIRRGLLVLLALLLALCGFAGCSQIGNIVSGVAATGEFPVTIGDVTVAAKPQKAVVLSPSLADVVVALGYETQLAAGDEGCTQPSLRSLTKLDGNDPQAVLGAAPDLVLADSFSDEMAAALLEANVTALTVAPATNREDFERLYSQVASAFAGGTNGYNAGIEMAQSIFTTLDDINRIVPKDKVTTACYLYDLESRGVTGDMLGSTIMSYAGVTNVLKSLTGGAYDLASLRVGNPDVIFCAPGLKDQLLSDSRFADFHAVQSKKVFELDASLMEWQGRTVVTTAYEISAACFPELLEDSSANEPDPASQINSQVSSMLQSSALENDTTPYETLQQGDQNEEVLAMQKKLDELGYLDVEYDGHYGEYTANCVREFQKENGLEETGIADAATQRKLYSQSAKPKKTAAE